MNVSRWARSQASRLNHFDAASAQRGLSCIRDYQTHDSGEHEGHYARCRGRVYERSTMLTHQEVKIVTVARACPVYTGAFVSQAFFFCLI